MRLSAALLGFLLLSACVFHGSPVGAQGVGDEIVVESANVNGWESRPPDPAQRIRGKITSHSAHEPHPPLLQRSESKGLTR